MDRHTNNGIYFYHVLFSMASFTLFVFIINGHNATVAEILFSIGMTVKYLFNRHSPDFELSKK